MSGRFASDKGVLTAIDVVADSWCKTCADYVPAGSNRHKNASQEITPTDAKGPEALTCRSEEQGVESEVEAGSLVEPIAERVILSPRLQLGSVASATG